ELEAKRVSPFPTTTCHPGPATSAIRLAQAQFSHECFNSFVVREAIRRICTAAISQDSRRRDLHYLDRPRLISHPNPRGKHLNRSDLVEMAQGHQTTKTARLRNPSSAFH